MKFIPQLEEIIQDHQDDFPESVLIQIENHFDRLKKHLQERNEEIARFEAINERLDKLQKEVKEHQRLLNSTSYSIALIDADLDHLIDLIKGIYTTNVNVTYREFWSFVDQVLFERNDNPPTNVYQRYMKRIVD